MSLSFLLFKVSNPFPLLFDVEDIVRGAVSLLDLGSAPEVI